MRAVRIQDSAREDYVSSDIVHEDIGLGACVSASSEEEEDLKFVSEVEVLDQTAVIYWRKK